MSNYAQGITEGVFVWMVLVAPINTTITLPNFTTKVRNSLFGLLAAGDFSPEINNQPIKLQKQAFGGENYVDLASGGQSWTGTFTLQTVGKYDIDISLGKVNSVSGTDAVDKTDGSEGTLLGNAYAGVPFTPHRWVFIPAYKKADGTFAKLTDGDLKHAWELPEADVMSGFNPTYNGESFVEYEVELMARTNPANPDKLWKHGGEITLVVTP